jgi:NAD(P)-dependent dehydrogenase (short-subunit alcohol dehydrogenase family)
MASSKTVIVTGASQGIGAAVVQAFLGRGYNVVATSRGVSKAGFAPSPNLALVDGDIGLAATAANIAQTAISKFGTIDSLVNNAGVFLVKPSRTTQLRIFVVWSLLTWMAFSLSPNLPLRGCCHRAQAAA